MLDHTQIDAVVGATAYDQNDNKIGKVGQLFLDDETGQPEFVTVNTGLFGTSESFVPVAEATFDGDRLVVPFSKDKVKDAPNVELDGRHLDESEEQRLYEYYGMGASWSTGRHQDSTYDSTSDSTYDTTSDTTSDTAGLADSARSTTTDDAMTRSEERVDVGTTSQEAGRARLRKYVVTEQETHTVPVRKEKAVLETEPITDANADEALSGPEISEDEHEVVLREERPVVETRTEPVERVRLGTESVTEQESVTADVRKERIEAEGDVGRR